MTITEADFTLKPSSACVDRYDLTFNKRVKKRDTGQYAIEPGDTLYGLTIPSAMRKIVHHRIAKKYAEDNITLMQFVKEWKIESKELNKLFNEKE